MTIYYTQLKFNVTICYITFCMKLLPQMNHSMTVTGVSPVQLSGLDAGHHELEITPLGCSGGSRSLSVKFTT